MLKFSDEFISLMCDVCRERPGERQVERDRKWLVVCRECLTDSEKAKEKSNVQEHSTH